MMFSKFLSLNPEKQERILNAATKEFALKGFENASTNEIVKQAGISKGLLFHYFKNKKELYLFLYNHFVEVLMAEFFNELDFSQRDLFDRLKNVMILKSKLVNKYPDVFSFMLSAQMVESNEIKSEMDESKGELLKSSYGRLFENIDTTKFREGLDFARAFNIIMWTLEGFSNHEMAKAKQLKKGIMDFDEAFIEVEVYIEMLKKSFYQEN